MQNKYNHEIEDDSVQFDVNQIDQNDLAILKREFPVTLRAGETTEETARQILSIVCRLFEHDGDSTPSNDDGITILREAQAGGRFRCVEYSVLAMSVLMAYGIQARTLGLRRKDVETIEYGSSHVVVEYFDQELARWVFCDVQYGVMIQQKGVSLGAVEIAELTNFEDISLIHLNEPRFKADFKNNSEYFEQWLSQYLYYIDTPKVARLRCLRGEDETIMLVPSGAKKPVRFQNSFDMNVSHTESVRAFYQMPSPVA